MSLKSRTRRLQRELELGYQVINEIIQSKGVEIKAKLDQGMSLADADREVVTAELLHRGQKPIPVKP